VGCAVGAATFATFAGGCFFSSVSSVVTFTGGCFLSSASSVSSSCSDFFRSVGGRFPEGPFVLLGTDNLRIVSAIA
jgi:hypothetical protein